MGHEIKAIYKQAAAYYQVANVQQGCIATLLYYAGQQHNCPPKRFVVLNKKVTAPTLADDLVKFKTAAPTHPHDPLFPEKQNRYLLLDNLV